MKLNSLTPEDLKAQIRSKLSVSLRDVAQNIKPDEFAHLLNRVSEIALKYDLTTDEFNSTIDIGISGGFGKFKKLTVHTVEDWMRSRSLEIAQHRAANEIKKENDRKTAAFAYSPLGKVVVLKYRLFANKQISREIYEKYTLEWLFETFSKEINGQIVFDNVAAKEYLMLKQK